MIDLSCKSGLFYDFTDPVFNGTSKKHITLTFSFKTELGTCSIVTQTDII